MEKIAIFFIIFMLAGCGPKEIGEGTSSCAQDTTRGARAVDGLRYPVIGANRTQQMLYYYNRPDVMQNYQNWRLGQFRKMMGVKPDPEDPAYRSQPKQRSPFRQ